MFPTYYVKRFYAAKDPSGVLKPKEEKIIELKIFTEYFDKFLLESYPLGEDNQCENSVVFFSYFLNNQSLVFMLLEAGCEKRGP